MANGDDARPRSAHAPGMSCLPLALLVLALVPAHAVFIVESGSLKVAMPEVIKGDYDIALANFGVPSYGGELRWGVPSSTTGFRWWFAEGAPAASKPECRCGVSARSASLVAPTDTAVATEALRVDADGVCSGARRQPTRWVRGW